MRGRSGSRVGAVRWSSIWIVVLLLAGCSPLYVLRAGYEEAKILSRRRPIARMVQDSTVPAAQREKLSLVLEVRSFAQDSLGLDVGDSYTTFSRTDSDTLAMVLSAAYRDRFEPFTWWFPIVGRVPYKGYFGLQRALDAQADMEEEGYDTYLRPTSAFSTLGWFNDPLVSPLLRYDSLSLAATVIHELFHNTLYLAGQAQFNESLAEFVGTRGAVAFFCSREGAGSPFCSAAEAAWHDELIFGEFLSGLVAELEALYARTDITAEETLRLREEVFGRSRERFTREVQPRFRRMSYSSFLDTPLNNATLLARRLYYGRLNLFEEVYRRSGGDLRFAVDRILEAVRGSDDPYGAVEQVIGCGNPATRSPVCSPY